MSQKHDKHRPRNQEQGDSGGDKGTGSSQSKERSAAEWVTLGISLAIILSVVGLVTYLLFSGTDQPPVIAVEARLDDVRQDSGVYYVPVVATNEGDQTVEAVRVRAELQTGAGQPQSAETTFTFLSGGEQVRGTLVFAADPAQGQFTLQPVSYQEP